MRTNRPAESEIRLTMQTTLERNWFPVRERVDQAFCEGDDEGPSSVSSSVCAFLNSFCA
jgi:hypothetical protein